MTTPLPVYLPNLPDTDALIPYLRGIEARRRYTNFGPLESALCQGLSVLLDCQMPPAVALASSGTDALTLALRALNLRPGARVLVPALTFPATATAALAAGLTPVLTDIDSATWQLTPEIARSFTTEFDLVVPVATFGLPLPVSEWDAFSRETGIPVVFDAAGGLLHQPMPQTCIATFSLHSTKPLGLGEGGLIASHDARLISRAKKLSNFDFAHGLVNEPAGNSKLSEYHAAVGLAQLARRAEIQNQLSRVRTSYDRQLRTGWHPAGDMTSLVLALPGSARSAAHALATRKIETRAWYHPDLAEQPAFANAVRGDLTNTMALRDRLIGLPFHAFLNEADVERVCNALDTWALA